MRVDLAVCTFGRGDTVLSTIKKSVSEFGAFSKVLVIDNNLNGLPSDITAALHDLPVTIIHEPATGLSRARNRALSDSTADYVWFIDDDASLCANFSNELPRHIERISSMQPETRPAYGGGLILAASEGQTADNIGRFELGLLSCMNANEPFAQPWGANMFVDREVALRVDGFDPRLGWVKETGALLGEEDDLFLRMQATVPEARRQPYFADRCSVHHWIPKTRRELRWLIPRALKGGKSNFIVYKNAPIREGLSAAKRVLKSPTRENLLFATFVGGKLLQRCKGA